jgi:hypothetical protein
MYVLLIPFHATLAVHHAIFICQVTAIKALRAYAAHKALLVKLGANSNDLFGKVHLFLALWAFVSAYKV